MQQSRAQRCANVSESSSGGFTLIELLVVIFIISILAGLITVAIGLAKEKAREADANSTIQSFDTGLTQYFFDYNIYPGYGNDDVEPEKNNFPAMYEALLGEKQPQGGGGKSRPYVEKVRYERIVVESFGGGEEDESPWEVCSTDDRFDRDVKKYYEDPWGGVYFYRENSSKRQREAWMINRSKFDLWSFGRNEVSESTYGLPEPEDESDDIGNGW